MKNLTTKLLLSALLFTIPALAGGNHNHGYNHDQKEISSKSVAIKATKQVQQLTKVGKIDTTWMKSQPSSIKQKVFSHNKEWVILFTNKKISDTSKQNLYLFYTLSGKYISANYTGN